MNRGYLERGPDPDDRRRIALELTERGQDVAAAVLRGVNAVEDQLRKRVSPDQIEAARSVLLALGDIKGVGLSTGAGRKRPARKFRRFSPIFPVRDLGAALAHYAALGFDTLADGDSDSYGFATRQGRASIWLSAEATSHSTLVRPISTSAMPTPSTRSGADRVSAGTPCPSGRRPIEMGRAHTPTRTGPHPVRLT